jgi:hypothetical protein
MMDKRMCLWMLMVSLLTGAEGCPCASKELRGLALLATAGLVFGVHTEGQTCNGTPCALPGFCHGWAMYPASIHCET